jgi:hypothetical protein
MILARTETDILLDLLKARRSLVMLADSDKHARSPFPYEKKFFKHLRPDQVPRFLRCITDPQKLPLRWFMLKHLTALQNRVDVEKVEAIRNAAGISAPVVVRIRDDWPWTIADGLHRSTAEWLDFKDQMQAHYADLSDKEHTVEPVPGAGQFDSALDDANFRTVDMSEGLR